MTATTSKPELLAPAGDWECAKAAVENGADAIYFGLERFNARMRANNFREGDLRKLMEFLHRRGVKGYVTFNTLVFANEMAEAEHYLRAIIAAGVDAAIVQDVGICRLIRRLSPDFPIHASTQMTVTSAAGVEFAKELGCNLVVLARECSLKEIAQMTGAASMPLEVFVHGALCVAYSGQCLTSEALGGRSANRGECAQACRMPYELISDGQPVPLGDRRYLLSPQDLAGLEVLPELVRAGVASLKIEGRLKSPEYVANITQVYRRAIDSVVSTLATSFKTESGSRYNLEMAFSRGLYTGWFGGVNNQELVHARFGKKRGVYLGAVQKVERDGVQLSLEAPLKPGDGIVFDAGRPDEEEEGGRVYSVNGIGNSAAAISFGRGDVDFSRVHPGDRVWKTSDPQLDRALRQSFAGETPQYRRSLDLEAHGAVGLPLTLIGRDEMGHVAQLESAMPLAPAQKQPLTTERLREQLGRLGGTPFVLGQLKNALEGEVILPMSELNRLRRDLVSEMESRRAQPPRWNMFDNSSDGRAATPLAAEGEKKTSTAVRGLTALPARGFQDADRESLQPVARAALLVAPKRNDGGPRRPNLGQSSSFALPDEKISDSATKPRLLVLIRDMAQLEAAMSAGIHTIYCEFEDPKKYRDAVARFRAAGAKGEIFVAPPRIFKTGEEWILKQVRSSEADGYILRNYDHLKFFADARRVGDFSFNVANGLSAEYFKNRFGLERLTASYDLDITQLEALLASAPPEWFEITIHQHIPMFHMEHCVFCAFLSKGTDYTNCGRPCDKHKVELRDRVGLAHPLKADAGCRNTVFNARAQTGAEYAARLIELGARHFRIEFVNETAAEATATIGKYRALLAGKMSGQQLWRELKLQNQLGVTRGPMAAGK